MAPDRDAALSRTNDGWLSPAEQRVLDWLAPRLPRWMTPDRLTALGFAGSIVALVGYALAAQHPVALWLVNFGLFINWFGDSLDGKVARQQGIERPRYGLFLDQSIDVVSQFLFALGLGLSGYVRPEIVAVGFAAYLMMTVQSLLRAEVTRVFHLATGGVGLTEIRCLFLIANVAFYFLPPRPFQVGAIGITYADALGLVWIAANLSLYLATMIVELRKLAREEPPHRSGRPGSRRER